MSKVSKTISVHKTKHEQNGQGKRTTTSMAGEDFY